MPDPQTDLFAGPPQLERVGPAPVSEDLLRVARALDPRTRLGTSSWSFPGWAGIVYGRDYQPRLLAREGLRAYGKHPLFRSVGLDRTYYGRIPDADLATYAEQVPGDFRFLVKAERAITLPWIRSGGAWAANPDFLDPFYSAEEIVQPLLDGLGEKLGVILFQFSPMRLDSLGGSVALIGKIGAFLRALPVGPQYAVEVRNPGLLGKPLSEALAESGVAPCYTIHSAMPTLRDQLGLSPPAARVPLVIRWMLHSSFEYEQARTAYEPFDLIVDEDLDSRAAIVTAVRGAQEAGQSTLVIANNKAEGCSPLSLFKLARALTAP